MELTHEDSHQAQQLIEQGYRIVSNRHRMISRIDRPDWKEAMADYHTGGFPGDKQRNREAGLRWVNGLRDGAADFYRRVISKDKITVRPGVLMVMRSMLRNMGAAYGWGGLNEYIPKPDPQVIDVSER